MKLILSESFERLLENISEKGSLVAHYILQAVKFPHFPLFLSQNQIGNWITWRETSGLISYYPANRGDQPLNEDGKWIRKGRQDMRIAAWAKKTLHPEILSILSDNDFSVFSTYFKVAEKSDETHFFILSGEEAINDVYGEEHFGSCQYKKPVGRFYEKMECDIAVCRDGNGKLKARAILWPEIQFYKATSPGKYRFMDRVYSESPDYEIGLLEWANKNKFVTKECQSKDYKRDFSLEGAVFNEIISLKCRFDLSEIEWHPYLDTMTLLSNNCFYNLDEDDDKTCDGDILFNQTDGDTEEVNNHDGQVEDIDGNWIDEDESIRVYGDIYHIDDERIVLCERDNEYILRSEAYKIEISGRCSYFIHESYVHHEAFATVSSAGLAPGEMVPPLPDTVLTFVV